MYFFFFPKKADIGANLGRRMEEFWASATMPDSSITTLIIVMEVMTRHNSPSPGFERLRSSDGFPVGRYRYT